MPHIAFKIVYWCRLMIVQFYRKIVQQIVQQYFIIYSVLAGSGTVFMPCSKLFYGISTNNSALFRASRRER